MGTEREIDALAAEGIAASEKEFFADAMGMEDPIADDSGDRSLEEMGEGLEGQHEPQDETEHEAEGEAQPELKAEGQEQDSNAQRDDKGRFQPQAGKVETPAERGLRGELTGERDKRKAIETEFTSYRSQMDQRFAALEARLAQAAQPKPQEQPQPVAEEIPDRWTDPDGYDRYQREQIVKQVRGELQTSEQRRVAWSLEEAKAKHGDAFSEAFNAANSIPANHPAAKQVLDMVMQSANPGERLIAWHKQQQAQREIGNDPAAYREKVAADARAALMKDPEFRKQVLGELQGEARGAANGGPRNTIKLPPSLNSAQAGAMARAGMSGTSDRDFFDEAMS